MDNKLLNSIYIGRDNFDTLQQYIDSDDFSGAGRVLYTYASEYYNNDPSAQHIDVEVILHKLKRNSIKNVQQYEDILYGFTHDISTINIQDEIVKFKLEQTSDLLVEQLVSEDPNKAEKVRELIELYDTYDSGSITATQAEVSKLFTNVDIADLLEPFSDANLIPIYPAGLNAKIGGGVTKQSHIVIFARPEIGKSLFAINMGSMMAIRGKRVTFVEMEDPTAATHLRFVSCLTGISRDELRGDPALLPKARKLLAARGYENITVCETANGTPRELERIIQETRPDILFVNQLRQLKFKGVDGEVALLARAGNTMRNLAKKYDIVTVSIHQAADEADGKLTLDLRDMYMSKTALQGDIDLALGIGANQEFYDNHRRMISVCKNKNGWHGKHPVLINEQLSRVRDIA